jgi:hypothetical protein
MGKLVVPNSNGMDFERVQMLGPKPFGVVAAPPIKLTSVELLKSGVTIPLRPSLLRLGLSCDPPVAWHSDICGHQAPLFHICKHVQLGSGGLPRGI